MYARGLPACQVALHHGRTAFHDFSFFATKMRVSSYHHEFQLTPRLAQSFGVGLQLLFAAIVGSLLAEGSCRAAAT